MPASFIPASHPHSRHSPRPLRSSAPAIAEVSTREDGGEPLVLPPRWTPPPRGGLPIVASAVPLVGAVVLWLVTGSVFSLWLALLGPLLAAATMLDGARSARRARGTAEQEADAARARVADAIDVRHQHERARLWARHPDVSFLVERDDEVWRAVPGRAEALVVGRGVRGSAVRVAGGEGDLESAALRDRAAALTDAPIVVPVDAGVVVRGPEVLTAAVVRALATQLCLAQPPGDLQLVASPAGGEGWAGRFPHHGMPGRTTLAVLGGQDPVPPGADLVLIRAGRDDPPPPRCAAVLTVDAPDRARLDYAGEVRDLRVEGLGAGQAATIGESLALRAAAVLGAGAGPARTVLLASLLSTAPPPATGGLAAVVGVSGGVPSVVDLVADGPHAVVAGVTGSGKSELLITWILALCAMRTTAEVSFLLADFKGGTAFDGLSLLPHVTGVITDLDGSGARRAIESLRAEVRWREAELSRVGARDITDPRVRMPRLVVVVDEFATLLGEHPELHAVFTDVAARGRALGMHLILGTQRVAGVVREALLANCPLRVSLRVTDAADSKAVVGTDQAASLPGGAEGRGLALIRRAADAAPELSRIALSTPDDVRSITAAALDHPTPRRPWLPDLPSRVLLEQLRGGADDGAIVLGLVDEPERQRQRPAAVSAADRGLLVVGGGGMGKTTALRTIAAQAPAGSLWLPQSPEDAWDALDLLATRPPAPGAVVIVDDLDALAGRFPLDHAHIVLERIERLVRGAGDTGILVAVSMRRPTGAASRIAELFSRRAVLAMPSRAEYIGAGGDPSHYSPDAVPGRGRLDGRAIQFALAEWNEEKERGREAVPWHPERGLTGFVGRRSAASRAVLEAWQAQGAEVVSIEEASRRPEPASGRGAAPVVVAGDPDEWQRQWGLLARIRGEHDLVIDASCAVEYRLLAGDRELPPYCSPGSRRAWLRRADGAPVRIALPGEDRDAPGSVMP